MVTASHNPKDYNGMKLVREESKPNFRGYRGEINSTLDHPKAAIDRILAIYEKDAVAGSVTVDALQ